MKLVSQAGVQAGARLKLPGHSDLAMPFVQNEEAFLSSEDGQAERSEGKGIPGSHLRRQRAEHHSLRALRPIRQLELRGLSITGGAIQVSH